MKNFRKLFVIIFSLGLLSATIYLSFENYKWINQWNYVEAPAEIKKPVPSILTAVDTSSSDEQFSRDASF